MYYIGLDIGSVSVNAVLMDEKRNILEDHYVRLHGQPLETSRRVLEDMLSRTPKEKIKGIAVTGVAGKLLGRVMKVNFVNEIVAQSTSTAHFYPDVRTIIEIGGEDSKLILLEKDKYGEINVSDFAMNTLCAAGTGSFLDQQASRLGLNIEKEFSELALKSKKPPRIAGRCSVFAKTDMIHLQQEATPDYDIVAGLCYALARNFKSNIGKGKEFRKAISFQGGVAGNKGIIKAFEDVLELKPGELLIPEHHASMGAIGAVLVQLKRGSISPFTDISVIDEYLQSRTADGEYLEALESDNYQVHISTKRIEGTDMVEAYVGVDVGSISTNVVVIDREGNVLSRRYLMTAGRPLKAVVQGLYEVGCEVGDKVKVCGVATTGSGRYLTGDFIGADIIKNEITSHATGAAHFNKEVDTIFEIGGQDSKYISLENGAIVDFTMNKVCAAGTGSFLEEQAEKLDINIEEEFGKLALSSEKPAHLGERCTVFMESELNHCQQRGVCKENLVGGLSYSIVFNYLNRVVEDRKVGEVIFFQGGTAYNRGIKAAFERVTGKRITVPPHMDVLGAIGVALIARDDNSSKVSSFKGFDLRDRRYTVDTFECEDCPNRCEIRKVSIEGERALHYGSRCGKFDEEKKIKRKKASKLPRLFVERKKFLYSAYPKNKPDNPVGKTVGIPQVAFFFELFPFFKAFFTELGAKVVISADTNRGIINEGLETVASESCFPIKVAHGHVLDLLKKDIDYLFLPSIIDMEPLTEGFSNSFNCPYVQCIPYLIDSALKTETSRIKILRPTMHFQFGMKGVRKVLTELAKEFTENKARAKKAIKEAFAAQDSFYRMCMNRGKEIIAGVGKDEIALVIVSRPYNGCDTGLNLNLPEKLRDLGTVAIPMDFLPLEEKNISYDYPHMYWKYGQRIIAAAGIMKKDRRLNAVYITNFGCGPDSFISKFFARELGGRPYLTIEIDEHSADVGAITRCEAYLDSLKNARQAKVKKARARSEGHDLSSGDRVVYVPYMDDHSYVFAAAMRACGRRAEALPMADEKALELGRKHSSGKECYPCILTTGDILKKALSEGFDPRRAAFLMPTAMGPCRFGQYNKFHRMVLDDLGFEQVPMVMLDQTASGYESDLNNLGAKFKELAWKGFIALDILQKVLRQTRPYEADKGVCDALYEKFFQKIRQATEKGDDLVPLVVQALEAFENVPVDGSGAKPVIGIVGEIYVRCTQFANNFIVRRIEELGGEAVLPGLEEWITYINYERIADYALGRKYLARIKEGINQYFQKKWATRLRKPARGKVRHFLAESSTEHILDLAKPYIKRPIRGEAVLSMGRAVEYAHEHFDGVVNLVPFNCMPGTIVNSLLTKYRMDYPDMPILKLAFDGLEQGGEQTRLEAFMHQAYQHLQRRLKKAAV